MRLYILFAILAFAQASFKPMFDGKTLKGWTACDGQAPYK